MSRTSSLRIGLHPSGRGLKLHEKEQVEHLIQAAVVTTLPCEGQEGTGHFARPFFPFSFAFPFSILGCGGGSFLF